MEAFIPEGKFKGLERQIKSISNKGASVVFDVLEHPFYAKSLQNPHVLIKGYKVNVEGSYKINGWEFMGVLEHCNDGNIVRMVGQDAKHFPARYLTAPSECEHCHKRINRKDTYLIYNHPEDKWMQVGSSCLKQYTNGLDAEVCAQMMLALEAVGDDSILYDEMPFDATFGNWDCGFSHDYALSVIGAYVKEHGYKPGDAKGMLKVLTQHDAPRLSSDDVLKVVGWSHKNRNRNDFLWNGAMTMSKEIVEPRDFALAMATFNSYYKEMSASSQSPSKHLGNVGDKIVVWVASIRVLFKSSYEVAWHTYATSYTYEIVDNDGNVLILKTSKDILSHGKPTSIEAKVKSHDEYKGIKQTRIERAKVLSHE